MGKRKHAGQRVVRLMCKNERHEFSVDRPLGTLPPLLRRAFAKLPRGDETPLVRTFYELLSLVDVERHHDAIVATLEGKKTRLSKVFASCTDAVLQASASTPDYTDVLVVVEDRFRISIDALPSVAARPVEWKDGTQPVPCMCVDVSGLV